jgi:hypothetical protein
MITEIYPSGTGTFTARIAHGKSSAMRTGFRTRESAQAYLTAMEPKMVSVTDMRDPDAYRYAHNATHQLQFGGRQMPHYILHSERN